MTLTVDDSKNRFHIKVTALLYRHSLMFRTHAYYQKSRPHSPRVEPTSLSHEHDGLYAHDTPASFLMSFRVLYVYSTNLGVCPGRSSALSQTLSFTSHVTLLGSLRL